MDDRDRDTDDDTVTVTEIIISLDGNEWMDTDPGSENEEDPKIVKTYYENIENVMEQPQDPLDDNTSYKPAYLPKAYLPKGRKPKVWDPTKPSKKYKSKLKVEDEDPFLTVDKFWSEHSCSDRCITKFTKEEVVQLRSACEALDEYVDGTNRLDLVILAMIRALVRTKKVRNRAYKAREERKSVEGSDPLGETPISIEANNTNDSEKERQKYTCNFMVEGQSVCRSFFLFVHSIGVKRWGRLMKVYKSEGLVEKYHGLCNRKPANTTPLENVQFVVEFLRKYAGERAIPTPTRLLHQSPDVKVLPLGESKSSVYDKYVLACQNQGYDSMKVVSKISFNRIWRQCCPNLLTYKPRANEKPCNGHSTENPSVSRMIEEVIATVTCPTL